MNSMESDHLEIPVSGNQDKIVALVNELFDRGAIEMRHMGSQGFVFSDPDILLPEVVRYEGDSDETAEKELQTRGWSLWSAGMSNQYGYNGGWLHASETLSEGMVTKMLRQGGLYALVFPTLDNGELAEEWGIVRKIEDKE